MSKAKTKEQYMDDLRNKNPQTIIVGEYINARTPTLHRCLIHGNECADCINVKVKPEPDSALTCNNIKNGRECFNVENAG